MCKALDVTTVEHRRHITDAIFLYKIVHSHYDSALLNCVHFRVPYRKTRNQDLFFIPKCNVNVFKFSCLLRVQAVFNLLTRNNDINLDINEPSLLNFKRLLFLILDNVINTAI